MKVSYPYRTNLRATLPHFRVEQRVHEALVRISQKYDTPMAELCRMAVDQLIKADWPRVRE